MAPMLFQSANGLAMELNAHFRLVPPDMHYIDGEPAGPIKEIVELAVTRAGHSIQWQTVPWKRTQLTAKAGQTDLLSRHSMNAERRNYLAPILIGYERRKVVFVTSPLRSITIHNLDDLKRYRIGQQRGYYYADIFNNNPGIKREIVNDHYQLVRMLKAGRIDAVVVSDSQKSDLASLLAIKGTELAEFSIEFINGRYCSIPIRSGALEHFNAINAEFFRLRKTGELNDIMRRHGASPYIQNFDTEESLAQERIFKAYSLKNQTTQQH